MVQKGCKPHMKTHIDCISSQRLLKLPGLVDIHVHVREPGATHKEDYASCTAAALAGGITLVAAMPNTNPSIVDQEAYEIAKKVLQKFCNCCINLLNGVV